MVLSFRFSVLLVDPRSAKAAGAKGINFFGEPVVLLKDANVGMWSITSLAVMQQFGRDRVESGHHADIVERSKMTSRPEEFHLRALPEPCVTLSSHTAPDVRPLP